MLDLYNYGDLYAATAGNYTPSPHDFIDRAYARVHWAGPHVRPSAYHNIIQSYALAGVPNADSFVCERWGSYCNVMYGLMSNSALTQLKCSA